MPTLGLLLSGVELNTSYDCSAFAVIVVRLPLRRSDACCELVSFVSFGVLQVHTAS